MNDIKIGSEQSLAEYARSIAGMLKLLQATDFRTANGSRVTLGSDQTTRAAERIADLLSKGTSGPKVDPLSIYVAGSSAEREEIAKLIGVLGEYGYTVTYDWTKNEGWGRPDHELTDEFLTECARGDLDAVRTAALVWYLVPRAGKSEGAATELGAALVLGKEVVVSGPLDRQRIFPRLAGKRFALHAEALEWLRVRAREWL